MSVFLRESPESPNIPNSANSPSSPIGVFDSGMGGLSVLRAIRRELPAENLLYLADSGNAPYGDRDAAFIIERATWITNFLLAEGAKAIVVACNTATLVAVANLRLWCPVPIVAMEPAIKPASTKTRSGVVGVLATSQTLASPGVARLCSAYGANISILLQAAPGLVEQVERGDLAGATTRALLVRYLRPLLDAGADTLVLGCTHYPFLLGLIREIVGPEVTLVDPAAAVARELARRLGLGQALAKADQVGGERFFCSGRPDQVQGVLSALWGSKVTVKAAESRADRCCN